MANPTTLEELTKADQGAQMTAADLRAALSNASPVEGLVVLDLIARAHKLQQDIAALRTAMLAQH